MLNMKIERAAEYQVSSILAFGVAHKCFPCPKVITLVVGRSID
jgi:hypothetical protein